MTKTKKIFIDAYSICSEAMSGIGHITLELIKGLAEYQKSTNEYEVFIIIPINKIKYINKLNLGVKIKPSLIPGSLLNRLDNLNALPPLDLFFGQGIYLFTNYRNWPLFFSKSLTYIHDLSFIKHAETLEKRNQKFIIRNIRKWVKRSNLVVTASTTIKEEIIHEFKIKKNKICVVPHGVDKKKFNKRISKPEIERTKRFYKVKCKNYFLYVGNVEPRKNLETLIAAHNKLDPETAQNYPLVIIGAMGWNNDKIEKMIEGGIKRGSVIRPEGFVKDSDLPAFYAGAKALIQPAIYEGFGVSPLQAISCGSPVILSDIPVFREIFGYNKDLVHFFTTQNSKELKDVMVKIIKTKRTSSKDGRFVEWSDTVALLLRYVDSLGAGNKSVK